MSVDPSVTAALGTFPAGRAALARGVTVDTVTAGAVNRMLRVRTDGVDWAVRLGGAQDAALRVNREAEWAAQTLAATHGFAPAIVAADADSGLLVSQWIDSPTLSAEALESPAGLRQLGARVRRLHAVHAGPEVRRVQPANVIDDYLGSALAGRGPVSRERIVRNLARAQQRSSRPAVFCHNDLHHRNVLNSKEFIFVDWEYAGLGEPLFELAAVASYHDLSGPAIGDLLAAYGSVSMAEFRPWQVLFDVVHVLWLDVAQAWDSLDGQRSRALIGRLSD